MDQLRREEGRKVYESKLTIIPYARERKAKEKVR